MARQVRLTKQSFDDSLKQPGVSFSDWLSSKLGNGINPGTIATVNTNKSTNNKQKNPFITKPVISTGSQPQAAQGNSNKVYSPDEVAAINNLKLAQNQYRPNTFANNSNKIMNDTKGNIGSVDDQLRAAAIQNIKAKNEVGKNITARDVSTKEYQAAVDKENAMKILEAKQAEYNSGPAIQARLVQADKDRHQARLNLLDPEYANDPEFGITY